MTYKHKQTILALINQGSISFLGDGKYRVRDSRMQPVLSIGYNTFYRVKKHCKKVGSLFVLDVKKVLSYHGNHFVKKNYKEVRASRKTGVCLPCPPLTIIALPKKSNLVYDRNATADSRTSGSLF